MNYGLQISASGALTAMYRQDVLANNLANINTAGFKPDVPSIRTRSAVRQEDGLTFMPSNALLERLGGGVQAAATQTEFAQGPIADSNNPLDVAIRGEGFFVVRSATSGSSDRLRLTRDGRMTLDSGGRLVMATTGMPVLDAQNRPIEISGKGPITIGGDGMIRQNGAEVATLNVVKVSDPTKLHKEGSNLYIAPTGEMGGLAKASGEVVQKALEGSAVEEISALMDVQEAGRAASANLNMISYQDRMTERAISQLGSVT